MSEKISPFIPAQMTPLISLYKFLQRAYLMDRPNTKCDGVHPRQIANDSRFFFCNSRACSFRESA